MWNYKSVSSIEIITMGREQVVQITPVPLTAINMFYDKKNKNGRNRRFKKSARTKNSL